MWWRISFGEELCGIENQSVWFTPNRALTTQSIKFSIWYLSDSKHELCGDKIVELEKKLESDGKASSARSLPMSPLSGILGYWMQLLPISPIFLQWQKYLPLVS